MIPGVNPRQLQQMMKQMGMSQDDISASEVIIKTPNKTLRFTNPQVQKIAMQGQTSFQVIGDYIEEDSQAKVTISEEDVKMVSEQAGVSVDDARSALEKNKGDIAEAIVSLS